MAFKLAPRVREITATTGTGTLSLGGFPGSSPGPFGYPWQSFVAGIGTGNTTRYWITSNNAETDWEIGIGTVTAGSPDTLSRDTVLASSNAGAKINLSGVSTVVCCLAPFGAAGDASKFLKGDGSFDVPSGGAGGGVFSEVRSALPTQSGTGFTTAHNAAYVTPTMTDGATGISISAASNASREGWYGLSKPAPTTGAKTVTALIAINYNWVGAALFGGIGYTDGTKYQMLVVSCGSSGNAGRLYITTYDTIQHQSGTSFTSNAGDDFPKMVWVQLQDDGTNINWRVSIDGATYTEVLSFAKSAGYLGASGYTAIFFGLDPYSANGSATLMSYVEN